MRFEKSQGLTVYRYGNYTVASNVALPELPRSRSDGQTDVTFQELPPGEHDTVPGDCFHQWQTLQGDVYLSFRRVIGGYSLHFTGRAVFAISVDPTSVRCLPLPGASAATLRHLFLDQVMPLLLSRAGRCVVHASAVKYGDGAVMFIGPSGQGKSTLASVLANGHGGVLADDCVVIEERGGTFFAVPSYPSLRLWPDSARSILGTSGPSSRGRPGSGRKHLLAASDRVQFCDQALPLARAYFLDTHDPSPRNPAIISPVLGRDAVIALIRNTFNLDIADRRALREQFESLSRLTARPMFYRLGVVRDLGALPAVRKVVEDHIARSHNRR